MARYYYRSRRGGTSAIRLRYIYTVSTAAAEDGCGLTVMEAYAHAVEAADREDDEELGALDSVDLSPTPTGHLAPARKGPRPPLRRGQPIDAYSRTQLIRLVQWIESDELIRTEDELLVETMRKLGFQKRGRPTNLSSTTPCSFPGQHQDPANEMVFSRWAYKRLLGTSGIELGVWRAHQLLARTANHARASDKAKISEEATRPVPVQPPTRLPDEPSRVEDVDCVSCAG